MLRNNLSMILAAKQLRITKVSNDTGLSRTTLTALAQNTNKMVQNDTINTLCDYLSITPSDFFEYVPFDFSYNCAVGDITDIDEEYFRQTGIRTYHLEGFLNVSQKGNKILSCEFLGTADNYGPASALDELYVEAMLRPSNQSELDKLTPYLNQLSESFLTDVKNDFSKVISEALLEEKVISKLSEIKNSPNLVEFHLSN